NTGHWRVGFAEEASSLAGKVPQEHVAVAATGNKQRAGGRDAHYSASVTGESGDRLILFDLPEAHRRVVASGGSEFSIANESDGEHGIGMSGKAANFLACSELQETNRAICATGEQRVTIGRKRSGRRETPGRSQLLY